MHGMPGCAAAADGKANAAPIRATKVDVPEIGGDMLASTVD
ncbi:hypothetical protein [Sphingomonas edaphi]|nr:hypothetical protein [Sphingomonas edaphi]